LEWVGTLSVSVDVVLAVAFPRLMKCLDSDSKTDITKVGEGIRGGDFSSSALATPRDRNIWEDVLSAAPSEEAMSEIGVE
jgi:hypothetical protein